MLCKITAAWARSKSLRTQKFLLFPIGFPVKTECSAMKSHTLVRDNRLEEKMKETKRRIGGWAMAIVLAGTSSAQTILTAPVKAMASEPVMVVEGSAVAAAAGPESAWSQTEETGA